MIRLEPPRGWDPKVTYDLVTARKRHRCDDCIYNATIGTGETYLRLTAYPGDESGYAREAGHPVRMALCMLSAPWWALEAARIAAELRRAGFPPAMVDATAIRGVVNLAEAAILNHQEAVALIRTAVSEFGLTEKVSA